MPSFTLRNSSEGSGADYEQPIVAFPGHWAPNDLHFYQGNQFPEHYKNGAFIAFHGSTIRAPFPQAGYFVGFVPFDNGVVGDWEVFADGFSKVDKIINTDDAVYRPMGIAMGPDGSLYISESEHGKIWRVMYKGDKSKFGKEHLAKMKERKIRPNIRTPDEMADNLTPERVKAGALLYNKYCGACHMANGKGDGIRFPSIAGTEWVKGDQNRLIDIVLNGMKGPIEVNGKPFDGEMPPADYLQNEEIAQILTYIRQEFGDNSPPVSSFSIKSFRYNSNKDEGNEE